ncbi:MAG TPA: PadR family transcriptional regulator [Solirubrobacteraceae bacterium]|nr:PadR family transcriptional regulator [Solirubrobacteraceae bacterium]
MSAKYAILGLVIERPGYAYQLAQRLERRFGSSAFAPSGVYSALDQLSREGHVRAVGAIGRGAVRRASPRIIYKATEAGVQHFERWMLGSTPAPPLRDDLHLKIALCRPRNVPRLIDTLYGQELACVARVRELRRAEAKAAGEESHEFSRRMRVVARDAEIASWKARIEWLQHARELLEALLEDYQRHRARVARAAIDRRAAGRLARHASLSTRGALT